MGSYSVPPFRSVIPPLRRIGSPLISVRSYFALFSNHRNKRKAQCWTDYRTIGLSDLWFLRRKVDHFQNQGALLSEIISKAGCSASLVFIQPSRNISRDHFICCISKQLRTILATLRTLQHVVPQSVFHPRRYSTCITLWPYIQY